MDNRTVKKHMEAAFNWLGKIPVSGDCVDYMAMARQELHEAFHALPDDNHKKEVKHDD